jgi:hypothetical protein
MDFLNFHSNVFEQMMVMIQRGVRIYPQGPKETVRHEVSRKTAMSRMILTWSAI